MDEVLTHALGLKTQSKNPPRHPAGEPASRDDAATPVRLSHYPGVDLSGRGPGIRNALRPWLVFFHPNQEIIMKVVVLRSLPTSPLKAAALARSVVTAMTGEPLFPSPSPSLTKVSDDLDALGVAEVAVLTRGYGTRATRDSLLAVVRADYGQLAAYVQAIADGSPVGEAEVVVAAAGMSYKKPSLWDTPLFRVVDGPNSGSVKLIARWAADRATYTFEYSLDGITWILVKLQFQCKTTLSGLTPGQTYLFRCRVATKDGLGDWCDVVSHLVR
jgi:hypothetical protein